MCVKNRKGMRMGWKCIIPDGEGGSEFADKIKAIEK
jgi:hypothetical protein